MSDQLKMSARKPKKKKNPRLGMCYELSAKVLMEPEMRNSRVVHGSIQGFDFPRIGHAWVLLPNDMVFDPVTELKVVKEVYYAYHNAIDEKIYDYDALIEHLLEFGTYGPWHEI